MITIKFRDDVTFQDLSRATGKHSEKTRVDTQILEIEAPKFDTLSDTIGIETRTIKTKSEENKIESAVLDIGVGVLDIDAGTLTISSNALNIVTGAGTISISGGNISINTSSDVNISAPSINLTGQTNIIGDIFI